MKCPKCGVSVMDRPFIRMNPKGVTGVWWCEKCCKELEPELYRNEIEDGGEVMKDLKDICYTKKQLDI